MVKVCEQPMALIVRAGVTLTFTPTSLALLVFTRNQRGSLRQGCRRDAAAVVDYRRRGGRHVEAGEVTVVLEVRVAELVDVVVKEEVDDVAFEDEDVPPIDVPVWAVRTT